MNQNWQFLLFRLQATSLRSHFPSLTQLTTYCLEWNWFSQITLARVPIGNFSIPDGGWITPLEIIGTLPQTVSVYKNYLFKIIKRYPSSISFYLWFRTLVLWRSSTHLLNNERNISFACNQHHNRPAPQRQQSTTHL